jgi:uncharacterized protein (DUF1800 family)
MVFTTLPIQAELPTTPPAHPRPSYQSTQLSPDERILHALNRFTFGPRPGDLEAIKAMGPNSTGLDRWFQQQLHPETIDQSDLNARLAEFPAMQLDPQDLLFRFPTNGVIRQTIDKKTPEPQNAALRKVYDNEIFRYDLKKQEKEQKQLVASSQQPPNSMAPSMVGQPTASAGLQPPSSDGNMAMSAPPPSPNTAMADQDMANTNEGFRKKKLQPAADKTQVDPALVAEISALPPQQRINRLAAMPEPDIDNFLKGLKPPQRLAIAAGLTPVQKEYLVALVAPQRVATEELAQQRLTRDIYSNTQLLEVMTDFWLNHFNVFLHKNDETPSYLVSFERDVIRPHALGKFEDLLEATAHSPAMLLYLDNSSSMGPDSPAAEKAKINAARHPDKKKPSPEGLNENYARELMELHTLGVNGGYTQADVTQVARILTGWTVDKPQRGGGFLFDPNRHEPGTKKVLGKKFKEKGEAEGRDLLHMLASSPATAHFLSRKLAIRFVGDNPPQALVDRLAKSYMSSGGDISKVLTALYRSPEFWAPNTFRNKVKTPLEFITSAARASNLTALSMEPLVNALRDMGMPLYGAVPPTGYNWQASTWVSTGALVNRMNFALTLASNKLNGITVNWANTPDPALPVESATATLTPESEEQRLEAQLVAGGLSDDTRKALLDQFNQQAQPNPQSQPNKQAQSSSQPSPNPQPQSNQPFRNLAQTAQTNTQQNLMLKVVAHPAAPNPAAQKQPPNALEKQDQLLAGLLLGSPEFQRR